MAQLAVENRKEAAPAVSLETLVYAALVLVVAVWRLAALGATPLGNAEAHDALAALQRLEPHLPHTGATQLFPTNALGALFNMASFTVMGNTEAAARLPTALAGVLLVLTPLLYRHYIGRSAAFMLAVGLGISPVAQAASRTMSGMVWAVLLLLVGGWLVLQFVETRQKGYALAATVCGAGILFLTTPIGILLLLGAFFGIAWGVSGSPQDDPLRQTVPSTVAAWAGFEAFLAAAVGLAVVATAFFTSPSGLSSISQVLETFYDGLTTRPANLPNAYILWVSLRYDLPFILFGVAGAIVAWRESTFLERFLTAWLAWGLFCAVFYVGGSPDMALLLTVPAIGLTVSLVLRLLQTTAYGFWVVPHWVIPTHSVVVAALLVSLVVSLRGQTVQLYEEARTVDYAKVLELGYANTNHVRIGTLKQDAEGSSMAFSLPYVELRNCTNTPDINKVQDALGRYCDQVEIKDITIQLVPLDEGVKAANFGVRRTDGTFLHGPETLGDGQRFVFHGEEAGEYRIDLLKTEGQQLERNAQYAVIVLPGDVAQSSFGEKISNGGALLAVPSLHIWLTIVLRAQGGWFLVLLLMLALLLPMTFFLTGAFYGARAAWRGVILGTLLYMVVYGWALGWQVTNVYGGDVRELWYLSQPAPEDYHTLQAVLMDYSERDNGTLHEIEVTVQGESDGALAWALRSFPHARFVDQLTPEVATSAVIAPDTLPRPILGQEYVGQQLVLDYYWEAGWLNWTDLGAWLFGRDTRIAPVLVNPYRLWIGKELYDVETVPQ